MADKYLKLTYDIYAAFTAGNIFPSSMSASLDASNFTTNPSYWYQYQYQWGGIALGLKLPVRCRYYQQQTIFRDNVLISLMNASKQNYILEQIGSTSDARKIIIDPTSPQRQFDSELGSGSEYTPTYQSAWCTHSEIEMQGQLAASADGTATITFNDIFVFHDDEMTAYNALLAAYPNNVSEYDPTPPQPVHDLYVGDEQVSVLYHGDERIDKAYLGDKVVLRNLQANIIIISG